MKENLRVVRRDSAKRIEHMQMTWRKVGIRRSCTIDWRAYLSSGTDISLDDDAVY